LTSIAARAGAGKGTGSGLTDIELFVFDLDLDLACCNSESALILASGLSTNGGGSISISPPFILTAAALTLALFADEDPALVLLDPTLVLLDPALTLLDPVTDPDPFLPCVFATDTEAALIVRTVPAIEDLEYR
jgi:hypothetical protein